jgi:Protein of unknown function (DUF2628)
MADGNTSDTASEQDIRTFVGPRADYYIAQWARPSPGMNWAAFLLSGLWLPYRKMYRASLILFAILLVESVLEEVVFLGILHREETPRSLSTIVGLVVAITCGRFGNMLYSRHTHAKIRELREQGLAEVDYRNALARRGGTNLAAATGLFLLFVVVVVLASVVTDMALGVQ